MEFSDKEENWIGCDQCDAWFHFACAGIQSGAIPVEFYCEDCERSSIRSLISGFPLYLKNLINLW